MTRFSAEIYEMKKKGEKWIKGKQLANRNDYVTYEEANSNIMPFFKGWLLEEGRTTIIPGEPSKSRYVCSNKDANGKEERRLLIIAPKKA